MVNSGLRNDKPQKHYELGASNHAKQIVSSCFFLLSQQLANYQVEAIYHYSYIGTAHYPPHKYIKTLARSVVLSEALTTEGEGPVCRS